MLVFYCSNAIDGGAHTSSQNALLLKKMKKYEKVGMIENIGSNGMGDGDVSFNSFINDTLIFEKSYPRGDDMEWARHTKSWKILKNTVKKTDKTNSTF